MEKQKAKLINLMGFMEKRPKGDEFSVCCHNELKFMVPGKYINLMMIV